MLEPVTISAEVGEAFTALRVPLRAYLRKHVGDPEVAEDLLQQVFVKALATRNSGRVVGNLTGWLYAVARTTAIDYHRSKRSIASEYTGDLAAPEKEDDVHLQEELATCLRPFVEALPVIYRDTLLSIYFEGKSARTIAQTNGLSISAIKSRSSRGRRLLKDKLLECCRVEVGRSGSILDYQRKAGTCCDATNSMGSICAG